MSLFFLAGSAPFLGLVVILTLSPCCLTKSSNSPIVAVGEGAIIGVRFGPITKFTCGEGGVDGESPNRDCGGGNP